jgi:hypothetical protein
MLTASRENSPESRDVAEADAAPITRPSSVRFVGDESALLGLVVTLPREQNQLARLYAVLMRAGVGVEKVRLLSGAEDIRYRLDLANLDGSPVPSRRWAELQAEVLDCILGAPPPADEETAPADEEAERVTNPPPSGTYPIGSRTMNVEPKPTLLSTWISPPCATAI